MRQQREPKREWDYIRLLSEMNADGIVITANNDEMRGESAGAACLW